MKKIKSPPRPTKQQDAEGRAILLSLIHEAVQPAFAQYEADGFTPLPDLATVGTILRVKDTLLKELGLPAPLSLVVLSRTGDLVICARVHSGPRLRNAMAGDVIIPEDNSPFMGSSFVSLILTCSLPVWALNQPALTPIARIPRLVNFLPELSPNFLLSQHSLAKLGLALLKSAST